MSYSNNREIRAFEASAAVEGYLIVAASGSGNRVRRAGAATDKNLGVAERVGGEAGKMLDVIVAGLTEVIAGGNIAFNDPVTADANGRAVRAQVGAANTTVFVVGFARAEAVAGDVIPIHVAPSIIARPA